MLVLPIDVTAGTVIRIEFRISIEIGKKRLLERGGGGIIFSIDTFAVTNKNNFCILASAGNIYPENAIIRKFPGTGLNGGWALPDNTTLGVERLDDF